MRLNKRTRATIRDVPLFEVVRYHIFDNVHVVALHCLFYVTHYPLPVGQLMQAT